MAGGVSGRAASRTRPGVAQTRPARPFVRWTTREKRIVEHYSNALLAGVYGAVRKAARDACRDLERLRRGRSRTGWQRSLCAVARRIEDRSWEMGRPRVAGPWSREELRLADGYARARLRGDYVSAAAAARAFYQDLDRLRKRYPRAAWLAVRRTRQAYRKRVLRRIHELGVMKQYRLWSRMENRMLEGYAQRLLRGEWRSNRQAARELWQKMEQRRRQYPKAGWFRFRRTVAQVLAKLGGRVRQLGRHVLGYWAPQEYQVVRRYAQVFLNGQYRSARQATFPCREELNRMHQEYPDELWAQKPRPLKSVQRKLTLEAEATGRRWPGTLWSPQQKGMAERYAQAYLGRRYRRVEWAARACEKELERRRQRNPRNPAYSAHRSHGSVVYAIRLLLGRSA